MRGSCTRPDRLPDMISPMNFTIRNAKIPDAGAISRLVTYWARQHIDDPTSSEAKAYLDTLAAAATIERIGATGFKHYVAENPAGLCGVIVIRDGSRIHHLFVQPGTHKQGVARALWEHAKARSDSPAFVVNSSIPAIPVYERFGFVASGAPQSRNGITFVPMAYSRHD